MKGLVKYKNNGFGKASVPKIRNLGHGPKVSDLCHLHWLPIRVVILLLSIIEISILFFILFQYFLYFLSIKYKFLYVKYKQI